MAETSVVIRTYNEARHLPGLLARLSAQGYRDFETIVVDSSSVDETREIARAWGAHVLRIDQHDFTFGYSLNKGIQAGTGRFIAIVSAHTLPVGDDWLANLIEPLRDADVAMVYGRQIGGPTSKFSECQDFRRTYGLEPRHMRPPNFFANNANSAIRRDLWAQHPFDESLSGLEDIEWARTMTMRHYRVMYEPSACLVHIHEETWPQVRHRYYREAVAARRMRLQTAADSARVVLRELRRLSADLVIASRSGGAARSDAEPRRASFGEILTFRYNKAVGTVRGLLDGTAIETEAGRARYFFDSSYEAVIVQGPARARLQRIAMPEVKPGDVVVRVEYVGVCGTDLEILNGSLGYFATGEGTYPIVPGHEVSGRIATLGARVSGLREGEAVVIECIQSCHSCDQCRRENWIGCAERRELGVLRLNGGYARYVVVPSRFVHRIPEGIDLARAALCEPLAVALKGLERLYGAWRPSNGSGVVAVVGGGPLGQLCARALAHDGHTVTVIDRDPKRRTAASESGLTASATLDPIASATAVVEATGDAGVLEEILKRSSPGSTMLLLGLPYARKNFTFESIVAYDKAVIGSVGSSSVHFRRALELLPRLDVAHFLGHTLPLTRFAEAWESMRQREHLKVMLRPD